MYANQDLEEVQYDLHKPRIIVYKHTWRVQPNTAYRCNLKLALLKWIAVLSFWIARNRSFQHNLRYVLRKWYT